MAGLSLYPFTVLRKHAFLLVIPFIPVLFLLASTTMLNADPNVMNSTLSNADYYFGGNIYLSASDLTQYDKIGADGLFPIMRLGGITKGTSLAYATDLLAGQLTPKAEELLIVFAALFLGYLGYAITSRVVYSMKTDRGHGSGINAATVILSLMATIVVLFFASFGLNGLQLVLLLNFGVFFMIAIPHAAAGAPLGESLYFSFDFVRFNLRSLVKLYLLCMGVAIAAPIGLLIVFMFPLTAVSPAIAVLPKLVIAMFGITFALTYQFIVCSAASYDFSLHVRQAKMTPSRYAKRIR